mgnify:CR=1 FL=1
MSEIQVKLTRQEWISVLAAVTTIVLTADGIQDEFLKALAMKLAERIGDGQAVIRQQASRN